MNYTNARIEESTRRIEESVRRTEQIDKEVVRDIRRLAEEAMGRLYTMDNAFNVYMSDKPQVRRCLRQEIGTAGWAKLSETEKAQCMSGAGMLGNQLDYYIAVRDKLSLTGGEWDQQREGWDNYTKDVCESSSMFRGYMLATRKTWAKALMVRVDESASSKPYLTPKELGLEP